MNEDNLKPAFELDGVSVAFVIHTAMGDTIIAKKIFEAVVAVEKNCKIDFVCNSENSAFNVMAFYRRRAVKAPCFSCGDETAQFLYT